MKKYLLLSLIALVMAACTSQQSTTSTTEDGKHFGETIDAKNAISVDALVAKLEKREEVQTKIEGKVTSVCQKKGCWMTLVSAEGGEEIFVKFKDYGFFMPLDLSGKTVVMQGKGFKETTPVKELQHYAEDEGKSKEEIEAITEPKVELKFMADGVVIKE